MGWLDCLACLERLDPQEQVVPLVRWVPLEMMVPEVSAVPLDQLDPMVLQVHVENLGQRVCLVRMACLAPWDAPESEVHPDHLVTLEIPVNLDYRD